MTRHSSTATFPIAGTYLGGLLKAGGEYEQALGYHRRALKMCEQLYPEAQYPTGHPFLAESLHHLGLLLQARGEYEQALGYLRRALKMYEQLYPESKYPAGHPDLAGSLINLGGLLKARGEYEQALGYHRRALKMCEQLYPESKYPAGHRDLAGSLINLGGLLKARGEYEQALGYHRRALKMCEQLYPESKYPAGHPDLAISLNNLGLLLEARGEYEQALGYLRRALKMYEQLYPESKYPAGHPDLAMSLHNLGGLLQNHGEYDQALDYLERALAMGRKLSAREIAAAPAAQALALLHSRPPTRSIYLWASRQRPEMAAASYEHVWLDKAALMRLQQRRHEAALVARNGSAEVRQKHRGLIELRKQLNRLLAHPGKDVQARDRRLAELTDEQEKLERELAGLLPQMPRRQQLDQVTAKDLAAKLPARASFIDFIRYGDYEGPKMTGFRYLAFIMAPGRPVQRIELGEAGPVEEAITSWRQGIERGEASPAPQRLRQLVWEPIARVLPADTQTVYLCPDGDLARLPFAALPGRRPGTVLLEEYRLALVPHGPWLLEQLLYPPSFPEGAGRLVSVGGIRYDPPGQELGQPYSELKATAAESRQVMALFPGADRLLLTGSEAGTAAIREGLAQARFAHLATHGYFDAAGLTVERRRLQAQWKALELSTDLGTERVGLGVRNPLGYVGLALAGANAPAQAGADGGILTGLGIVDLPLEEMRLCVLSACDTGLGELTEGEGVLGLQRAFHVAGCPNVVGSLWQVNDAATAALMAQFYHELWVTKRPPLEALREAQLTIYRHPERIADSLAGARGRPALEKAARLGPGRVEKPGVKEPSGRAPTKLWAAFVLSGVGR